MKTICPYCERESERIWEHIADEHQLKPPVLRAARWELAKDILKLEVK